MLAFLISLCYSERKPPETTPPTLEVRKLKNFRGCGYLGCINDPTEDNAERKAIMGRTQFLFCSEYCYDEWLRSPQYRIS